MNNKSKEKSSEIKDKGGAPEHEPTLESRAKVVAFSCAGFSQTQIANYFDLDDKTLRKHYRYELDNAKLEKISIISDNIYKMALEGNERMAEFILKCQGRWSYAKPPEDEKPTKTEALLEKIIEKL